MPDGDGFDMTSPALSNSSNIAHGDISVTAILLRMIYIYNAPYSISYTKVIIAYRISSLEADRPLHLDYYRIRTLCDCTTGGLLKLWW